MSKFIPIQLLQDYANEKLTVLSATQMLPDAIIAIWSNDTPRFLESQRCANEMSLLIFRNTI